MGTVLTLRSFYNELGHRVMAGHETEREARMCYNRKQKQRQSSPAFDLVTRLLKCRFTSTKTVGLLGTGAQDVHLDFHTAPEL